MNRKIQLPPSDTQIYRSHECRYGKQMMNNGPDCRKCAGIGVYYTGGASLPGQEPVIKYDCVLCAGTGRDCIPWSEIFSGWTRQ